MSGASDILDPVAAARDDIHRSKDLIASSLDDLRQHHLWLEDYHRAERRRVQRLHRQEVLQQLERKRRRTMGTLRRAALISFFVARAVTVFLVKHGTAFVVATYRLTVRTARWTAPRAVALTRFLLKELAAGLAWSWATSRYLAREGLKGAVVGLTWMARTSDVAGVAFRQQLAAWFVLLSAKATFLARPVRAKASLASARTRHWSNQQAAAIHTRATETWSWLAQEIRRMSMKASGASAKARDWSKRSAYRLRAELVASSSQIAVATAAVPPVLRRQSAAAAAFAHARSRTLALATMTAASSGWTWIGLQTRDALQWRNPPESKQSHALIVRQCTALVIFEPRRPRLPTVLIRSRLPLQIAAPEVLGARLGVGEQALGDGAARA